MRGIPRLSKNIPGQIIIKLYSPIFILKGGDAQSCGAARPANIRLQSKYYIMMASKDIRLQSKYHILMASKRSTQCLLKANKIHTTFQGPPIPWNVSGTAAYTMEGFRDRLYHGTFQGPPIPWNVSGTAYTMEGFRDRRL